jgi:hypothetical protein
MCRKSGVVVVLVTERSDVIDVNVNSLFARRKENLLRFIVACGIVDWDRLPTSENPSERCISSFLVCFLSVSVSVCATLIAVKENSGQSRGNVLGRK